MLIVRVLFIDSPASFNEPWLINDQRIVVEPVMAPSLPINLIDHIRAGECANTAYFSRSQLFKRLCIALCFVVLYLTGG